jgi:mono/diheme cytochrome c family protein
MRLASLFSWLIFGLFVYVPRAQSAGHHGNISANTHADIGAKSHGHHGAAVTPTAPSGHWSAPAAEKARANPVPMSREGLMAASELYRENCAACHGAEGHGNGPSANDLEQEPANLYAMAQNHSDGDLRWKIAKGRGEMPGWEEVLSDEQIWMLVHYMKSLPAYFLANRQEKQ